MQPVGHYPAETSGNKDFQEQSVHKYMAMSGRQDYIPQLQHQVPDGSGDVYDSIRALVTRTYELYEHPNPRLFIILPKTTGHADHLKDTSSRQFRLYFLCECGTHHVHLAKHEGYDLENISGFFERYKSYVLTLMQMTKYGISAAGLTIPPVNPSILEGLETTQRHLMYLKENIVPLVDDTINFLSGTKGSINIEALEGADPRQLESFLKVKDQESVLGNLYRVVSPDGHVRWVCSDHYRAAYQETAIKQLRHIVESSYGMYNEDIGKVRIRITSKALAKQFYEAMIKARGVQELEITLEWDATMDDLRDFSKAVTKANVVSLTMDGTHLKGPTLDVVNRARRFDPIMLLGSNGRIQSLDLKGFEDFFGRLGKSSLALSPSLRVLSLDSEFPSQDKVKSLNNLLAFYPGLAILHVKLQRYESIGKAISNILDKLGKLESLKVDSGTLCVTADVVKRKVQNVILAVDRLDSISPNDLNFIQKESVTKIAIRCNPQHWDEDRLSQIFHTSEFIRMRTMHGGGHTLAVAATLGWNVQDLVEMVSSAIPKLESLSVRYNKLALTAEYSLGTIWDMVTTLESLSDLSANDLAFIHQGNITRLVISDVPREEDGYRLIEILRHNPGLTHIQIEHKEQPQDGIVGVPMKLQNLAKLATHDALPKLELLKIDVKDVSFSGNILLQEVDLTIKQLSGLYSTALKFFQRDQLTRLTIRQTPLRNDENPLIDILSKFPSLSHLVIGCEGSRAFAVINLVVSTREKILEQGGSSNLRTFELMDNDLAPFETSIVYYDNHTHIQSHLSFTEGSKSFNMRTWLRLRETSKAANDDSVYDFAVRYGWSIEHFDGYLTGRNTFVEILNHIPNTKSLQFSNLMVHTKDLVDSDIDYLAKIVQRSPNLKSIDLCIDLNQSVQVQKVESVLHRYGTIVSRMYLNGTIHSGWSKIVSTFPNRNSLPELQSIELWINSNATLQSDFASWIIAMVTAPSRVSTSPVLARHPLQSIVDEPSTHSRIKPTVPWKPTKKLTLRRLSLRSDDWRALMRGIDFTAVESLDFRWSNLSQDPFKLLFNRIALSNASNLPLKVLDIRGTEIVEKTNYKTLETMLAELQRKAPGLKVEFIT